MDINEKQQIAESIKTIIKARWFFGATVFLQGLIVKIIFPKVPLASTWELTAILGASYVYNISYWLYVRRPIEKMTALGLNIVKNLQIPLDVLTISFILFYSGTIDKMLATWYFVSLMIGIAIYRKKGVILSAILCSFLYSGLAILEYYGFLTSPIGAEDFLSVKGNIGLVTKRLIGFNSYVIAAAFFVWFLGDLFRRRERRLIDQKNDLTQKTDLLIHQTQELTQAKGQLEGALTKSDVARRAASEAKDELEKANVELKQKIEELEKFYKVTVGREVKMVELKSEIKELKQIIKKLEERSGKNKF